MVASDTAAVAAEHVSAGDTRPAEGRGQVHAPSLPPFVFALFFILSLIHI